MFIETKNKNNAFFIKEEKIIENYCAENPIMLAGL